MYVKRHGVWFSRSGTYSKILNNVDQESFQSLSSTHGRDKTNVFFYDAVIEGADPNSFDPLNGLISKDHENIYCGDGLFYDETEFHVPTFEWIGGKYFRDENNIYCIWYFYDCYTCDIVDGDADTFRIIGDAFAADKTHVFNHGSIVERLDPGSTEMLSMYFLRDDSSVYFLHFGGKNSEDIFLSEIDAEASSFKILNEYYAADKNTVFFYYNCHGIARAKHLLIECIRTEIEPNLFQPLEADSADEFWPDATDGKCIFFHGRRIDLEQTQFELEEHDGEFKIKMLDLDAYFTHLSAQAHDMFPESWGIGGASATLGDILHPLHFHRAHRTWLLSNASCEIEPDERRRSEARDALVEVWTSFDRGELQVAMKSLENHPFELFELSYLVSKLQGQAASQIKEPLGLFFDRNEILFRLSEREHHFCGGYQNSAMNSVIYQVLGRDDHKTMIGRLVTWAEYARDYAHENANLPHNLACVFGIANQFDEAFRMCEIAIKNNYKDWKKLRDDKMLGDLSNQPRFKSLFQNLKDISSDPDADIPF